MTVIKRSAPAPEKPPEGKMTFETFMKWYETAEGRWELHDGVPVRLHDPATGQAERIAHGRVKARIFMALERAIQAAGLDCEALPDGLAVRINDEKSYEPDAQVYCGERLGGDGLVVPDPLIVVEVLSPSTALRDLNDKVAGYFSLASVMHYLIIDPVGARLSHYQRVGEDIHYKPVHGEALTLEPPGLRLELAALFAA